MKVDGKQVSFLVQGPMTTAVAKLADFGVEEIISGEPSLAEVFLGLYEGDEQ